jgi:hypothetical protein
MINDQFSPEEQTIIQQIQAVPRLELGSAAREAIRGRMLDEFRVVGQQSAARAAAQTRLVFLAFAGLIVITIIVILVIIAAISSQNTAPQITTTAATPVILSASPEAATVSAFTSTSPALIVSPTAVAQVTLTNSKTATPTVITRLPATDTARPSQPPTESADVILSTATQEALVVITPSATEGREATQEVAASTTPTAAPSLTPSATATSPALIVIEGPVINIVNNIITIYDFEIEVEPNHPILNLIEIGDLVHIEGAYDEDGVVVAAVISNLTDTPLVSGATVSLDGPVESINGNIIVVNGIPVQLEADDPLLQTVQVGQFVSVQGNFQGSGPNIVLVVITIVVNTNVTVTNNGCWYHESGMSGMGHWHCDGMGMGMGNPGMGDDGMGMGMGNAGMGMGG